MVDVPWRRPWRRRRSVGDGCALLPGRHDAFGVLNAVIGSFGTIRVHVRMVNRGAPARDDATGGVTPAASQRALRHGTRAP